LGVHKCHSGFAWSLMFVLILTAVPRYWEMEFQVTAASVPLHLPPPLEFFDGEFERNETLSTTLESHDIAHAVAWEVSQVIGPVFDVRNFKAGNPYMVIKEADGSLRGFDYTIDDERILKVEGKDSRFTARIEELEFEIREGTVTATVVSSLWGALEGAPKGEWLVMELAAIFESQVDFYKDIRSGDAIRLMVEEKYHRGEFVKYGPVRAAEFVNQGKPLQAYLFRDEYYDEKGMSARRSLLPSPVKFTRISSGFTYRRLHPIFRTVRPHLGVDYAAPSGTPVVAVSNATVTFAGTNGGFGRMVTLRHPNGMTTSYAHLSRILVNKGQRVKQSETVGLVGMTGTATGPHLDYRMTVSGKIVDPRTVRADPPKPISPSLKGAYISHIAGLELGLRNLEIMTGN
jgi:murein DD-endopeptidase MepM/ murein hydrolase activator NlpD